MTTVWRTKKLGEVATLQRGFDLPIQSRVNGKIPIVSSSGVIDTHDKYSISGPGVVTGRSGSVGNVFFVEEDFWPLNTVLYVKDFHGNDPRFIFHLLNQFDLRRFASGTGVPTLNRNFVHDELISIPTLSEQKRIVCILDKAFESIAAAKANAEKNLQNARALFESHLQSVFTRRGEGWVEMALGTLATFRNGINYTKNSKGEQIRIIGVKDFQTNFWVPADNLDTVTIDGKLNNLDLLRQDDILAVRSNGNVELIGRCMLAGEIAGRISHSGFTIRVRLETDELLPKYLCHFLKCPPSRKRLIDGGNGTNIKSLNQQTLSTLKIPFRSREEQAKVVSQIDALSSKPNASNPSTSKN